jgi:putative Holliday junction resolvase
MKVGIWFISLFNCFITYIDIIYAILLSYDLSLLPGPGGYYYTSSGMGICVATRSHFDLQTCEFVDNVIDDDDDEDDDVDDTSSSSLSPHDVTSVPQLSSSTSPPLRSIGVDYGLVRTGIAVTSGGYSPCPLAILSGYNNGTDLSTRIVDIVVSERATNVVLGLPLNKNGTASEQSELTRAFGKHLAMELRKRCGHTTKVVLWDERYTSKEARSRIAAEAMARNRRIPGKNELSGELDADCACIILENYYADEGWSVAEEIRLDEIISQECDIIYTRNLELNEKIRLQRLEEQDRRRNARREMIDRDMALTKRLGGVEEDASTKRKKKKKKK